MPVVVFDLETSGLPLRYSPYTETKNYATSRIVSICWMVFKDICTDVDPAPLSSNYYIVKPEGFLIPFYVSKIHGITNSAALRKGKSLKMVIRLLWDTLKQYKSSEILLVAHNIIFDKNVLLSEIHRLGDEFKGLEDLILGLRSYCTMRNGTSITKIELPRVGEGAPRYKNPKLIELYNHFFPEAGGFNQHNAEADTMACARCYFKINV